MSKARQILDKVCEMAKPSDQHSVLYKCMAHEQAIRNIALDVLSEAEFKGQTHYFQSYMAKVQELVPQIVNAGSYNIDVMKYLGGIFDWAAKQLGITKDDLNLDY